MKKFLIPLLLLSSFVSAQTKQDTSFSRWGSISYILHQSQGQSAAMTKAERFQRGISGGAAIQTFWQLDSISFFDERGTLSETKMVEDLDPAEILLYGGKRGQAAPAYAKPADGPPNKFQHFGPLIAAQDVVNVAGHVGDTKEATIHLWITGEEAIQLVLKEAPRNINLHEMPSSFPAGAQSVSFTTTLTPGVSQQHLHFIGPDNQDIKIRIAQRGHDLSEADFTTAEDRLPFFDAREREHLYLRLQSTEKLLNLYRDDKLIYHFPVGRQLDQLPVYHLPSGDYRMEVIDLGTGERRSYGLRR